MILYFHRFSPEAQSKKNDKRGGKLKIYYTHKQTAQDLTPDNRYLLLSLGFQICV